MKKYIILLLLISNSVFGQKKTADRYFKKGDYINAALHYEKYLDRYQHSKEVTKNIATSYYKTFQFRKARFYLQKLIKGRFIDKDKSYDNSYNFKMYQVLSALGNFEQGITHLNRYKKNKAQLFDKETAIENIEYFKLKDNDYTIQKLLFNTVNTSEFGAVRHKDSLYFVSDRTASFWGNEYKWTHKPFLDIYRAKILNNKVVASTITALPNNINSKLHEGNFCFSKDGNTMYFSRSNIAKSKKIFDTKKVNNVQLFSCKKVNGIWGAPKKLPFCKDGFSYQHPALNPKGDKLYFSSNHNKQKKDDYDIFYVEFSEENEQYGDPINLGTTVNTEHREHFPFISKDGNLFFSSNGHLGLGMLDIFVSEKKDKNFTKPINLGAPINSKFDDFNLNYYDDTKGYFASNRKLLSDDIYSFEQIGEIFEREYINIFEVRDADTKEFIANSKVCLVTKKSDTIYRNTLGEKASFTMNLLPNTYRFFAEADSTYFKNSLHVKTAEKKQKYVLYLSKKPIIKPKATPKITKPIVATKKAKTIKKTEVAFIKPNIKSKKPVVIDEKTKKRNELLGDKKGPEIFVGKDNELYFKMPPIYFEFNKWTITKKSKKALNELAKKLERYPEINVKISAHTDNRGTKWYNQVLSERRAEATRNYLALEAYINARRFKFEGFGESIPLIDCKQQCTEEEHQLNRRSEFKIIKY